MAWRLAKSLETLRSQINAAYPNRSKASDGTIGDAAHAASASDHNPNRNNVVCAFDITHDPARGLDAHKLAEYLRTHRHPNLRYIISNARIAGWWTNWQWQPSSGHTQHVHISVGTLGVGDGQTYDRYDSTQKWDINYNGGDKVNDEQRKKWARETRRAAYALYLNRGLSIAEYKLSDRATDPDKIKLSVAHSAESTRVWNDLAKKYGVTITAAEIKKHQDNYLNMWPARFFVSKVPAAAADFVQVTEPLYRKKV